MTRLSTFVFALVAAAASVACSSSPTDPVNTEVTLAPGQSTAVGALTVKFIGVTIDTRCPANAMCIQVGDAYIALEASVSSTRRAFELQVLNPMNRETEIRGYTVGVEALAPYPFAPEPIDPANYRVTLRVTR